MKKIEKIPARIIDLKINELKSNNPAWKLLDNEHVMAYITNLRSVKSQRNSLLALNQFFTENNLTPTELIRMAESDIRKVHRMFVQYHTLLLIRGRSSLTALQIHSMLRSFLKHNGYEITIPIPRTLRGRVECDEHYVPTQEEVMRMFQFAPSLRDKSIFAFLVQSGQRINTITALRLRHVVKSRIRERVTAEDIPNENPLIIEIPANLRDYRGWGANKNAEDYRFVIGLDAITYLKQYLRWREKMGEKLTLNSWLFTSFGKFTPEFKIPTRTSEMGLPLHPQTLNVIVLKLAEKSGIQSKGKRYRIHAHTFRRYWKTQMRNAGVHRDLVEFMMGHKMPYGGAYDIFTETEIRKEWLKNNCDKYLSVTSSTSVDNVITAIEMAKTLGATDEMINLLKTYTPEEALKILLEKRISQLGGGIAVKPSRQIIVTEEELEGFLAKGSEIVTVLPSGRIVIKISE